MTISWIERVRFACWYFNCDNSHHWIETEQSEYSEPNDPRCPECGGVAITARREPFADRLSFRLVSQERVTDTATGHTIDNGKYIIYGVDPSGDAVLVSKDALDLKSAFSRIEFLGSHNVSDVLNRAVRVGFSRIGKSSQ